MADLGIVIDPQGTLFATPGGAGTSLGIGIEQVLKKTEGVDLKVATTTDIYTATLGRSHITKIVLIVTAADNVTGAPVVGAGVAAGEEDVFMPEPMMGLNAAGKTHEMSGGGIKIEIQKDGTLKLGVDTGATATTLTVDVYVFGVVLP